MLLHHDDVLDDESDPLDPATAATDAQLAVAAFTTALLNALGD